MIRKPAVATRLAMVLGVSSAPHAWAAIDINGSWGLQGMDSLFMFPFYCVVDVTQTGTALTVTGTCPLIDTLSLAGTIDTVTGAFSLAGTSSNLCTTSLTVSGTANATSTAFDGGSCATGSRAP